MIPGMAANFGTRIKLRRQALGMNQEQFAERIGVHVSTVGTWEKGQHFPERYQGAIEAVLGISLTEDGDGQPDVYTDPDEAALWSLTRYSEEERRALIAALRERRRLPA
jgi:transcriptional regulator with XRE-family HTH domain